MASSRTPTSQSPSEGPPSSRVPTRPEEGDYIINWHMQYCISLLLQSEAQLRSLSDQIKAEVVKMKTDGDFIKHELPGPHSHLTRLRNEERDLRSTLESITQLQELFRLISSRSSDRIIP